jgi:fucose permease
VGVMTLLPSLLADRHGFSQPQSALVVVAAMLSNLVGAMLIVATRLRRAPNIMLPVSAAAATFLGFLTISGLADVSMNLTFVMLFCASIGIANALIWSLLPAAVPFPDAAGATAGLITQGSFIGVMIGPPTYFWIRHESPVLIAALSIVLIALMLVPLFAQPSTPRSGSERAVRSAH